MEFDGLSSIIVTALGSSVVGSLVTNIYSNWHEGRREKKRHVYELNKIRFQRKQEVGESIVARLSALYLICLQLENIIAIIKKDANANSEFLDSVFNEIVSMQNKVIEHHLNFASVAGLYFSIDSTKVNEIDTEVLQTINELIILNNNHGSEQLSLEIEEKSSHLSVLCKDYQKECIRLMDEIRKECTPLK
jgi:hypothetical protein